MNEQEAKTKWCPFAQALGTLTKPSQDGTREVVTAFGSHNRGYAMGGALHNCMCIGSACMAWRWTFSPPPPNQIGPSDYKGHCGLAGKP